jgi:predicted phosphohydrolase
MDQVAQNIARETPPADLLLIAGDLVWNSSYTEIMEHLKSLQALQARNICFIEGNHDHWVYLWGYSMMYQLFNTPQFYFLSGKTFILEDVGICGIRGSEKSSSRKTREFLLLQKALNELNRANLNLTICLIHYPPSSQIFKNPAESFAEDQYFDLMEEFGINKVVYGHMHTDLNLKINSFMKIDNIELYCTSIDYFNWQPVRIL